MRSKSAVLLVLTVFSFPLFLPLNGQNRFEKRLERSGNQWILSQLPPAVGSGFVCPPNLASEIPELSDLDEKISRYTGDATVESSCIQLFFADNCSGFYNYSALIELITPQIEEALTAAGLDTEFSYLPLILSGFNNSYESINRSGLWGLDLTQARSAGLRVDLYIDERKVPELATNAAVKLLGEYKERYKGDKIKMIAAMLNGQRFADQMKESFTPSEDFTFAMTLLRVGMRLDKHTTRENRLSDWLTAFTKFEELEINDTLSFDALVQLLNVQRDLVIGLNPAFRTDLIVPNDGINLWLPPSAIELYRTFPDSVAAYRKSREVALEEALEASRRQPEENQITYRVRSGDVLGTIARRHGVKVRDLKEWNNLRSDRINIGQKLVIYTSNPPKKNVRKKEETSPTATPPENKKVVTYVVKSGDSLWLIARNYPGVSAENIMEWNGIDEGIQPGMELKIYVP